MESLSLLIKPVSSACNMACDYCFYRATDGERDRAPCGMMSAETVGVLAEKLRRAAPRFLSIAFQGGEPTLAGLDFYRDFVRTVRDSVAPHTRLSFGFQTNGLLLDDDFAAFFKENGFLVGLSIDGDRATFDRCRRGLNGESVFDRVMGAADLLRRHGVDFNVLSVVTDESASEIAENYAFFKRNGLRYLQFVPLIDEGEGGAKLSPERYAQFLKTLFDLWYDDFQKGTYVSVRAFDNYLSMLFGCMPENCAMSGVCGRYFTVESGGELYPCDFYCKRAYLLGNLRDDAPFADTPRHAEFVDESLRIRETCGSCRWYALCRGGCRRDRVDDLRRNRYCEAYKAFFEYAAPRLETAARTV